MTETAKVEIFQFLGLLWTVEYNAYAARLGTGVDAQTVNATNALLTAYAALEALVSETAAVVIPSLYSEKKFRRAGLNEKFTWLLRETGRGSETVPPEIQEISDHRIAVTHSEPDNERSAQLGKVISATDALRFARAIRTIALWLWQDKRPGAVAHDFDKPNAFLKAEELEKFKAL
jgi:hypothetical protein